MPPTTHSASSATLIRHREREHTETIVRADEHIEHMTQREIRLMRSAKHITIHLYHYILNNTLYVYTSYLRQRPGRRTH